MVIRIVAILLLSAALGAGSATLRGLPWAPDRKQLEQTNALKAAVQTRSDVLRKTVGVSLEEFKALIAQGAVVIDARAREDFEKGHLKTDYGAPVLNVEPDLVGENLGRLIDLNGQTIVLYCNSDTCELAEMLYIGLEANQFTNMHIYFPGWDGITKAGLPTTSGPDTWTGLAADPSADGSPAAGEADPASEGATGETEHE